MTDRTRGGGIPAERMRRLQKAGHMVWMPSSDGPTLECSWGPTLECSCGWWKMVRPGRWWMDDIADHFDAVERDLLAAAKASAEQLDEALADAEQAFLDANYPG